MNAPRPEKVNLSPGVDQWLRDSKDKKAVQPRFKKVVKAIKLMREVGPAHPGFHTHQMKHLNAYDGRKIWNSYVENKTPAAWRMYWVYDNDANIYILSVGPHDHDPTAGESG